MVSGFQRKAAYRCFGVAKRKPRHAVTASGAFPEGARQMQRRPRVRQTELPASGFPLGRSTSGETSRTNGRSPARITQRGFPSPGCEEGMRRPRRLTSFPRAVRSHARGTRMAWGGRCATCSTAGHAARPCSLARLNSRLSPALPVCRNWPAGRSAGSATPASLTRKSRDRRSDADMVLLMVQVETCPPEQRVGGAL